MWHLYYVFKLHALASLLSLSDVLKLQCSVFVLIFLYLYTFMATLKIIMATYTITRWFPAPDGPTPSTNQVSLPESSPLLPPHSLQNQRWNLRLHLRFHLRPNLHLRRHHRASSWDQTNHPSHCKGQFCRLKLLLETITIRHSVSAIICTATEECEDLPWKRSHNRSKFYFCLIIPVIPHHLKWLSPSKVCAFIEMQLKQH